MSDELLTTDEHRAIELLAEAANTIRRVIGDGPQAGHDWAEAAAAIHVLQRMVMGQAAARAYPEMYRTLGNHGAWRDREQSTPVDGRAAR